MVRIGITVWFAILLMACRAPAVDQERLAESAENKAETLEQIAGPEGGRKAPPSGTITPTEVQAVDPEGEEPLDEVITCLARTIYWEAKGEDTAGMEAIANVVMNRLGHEGFPDTVCETVKQGVNSGSCQFSWWCDGKPDDAEEDARYTIAKETARKALNRQLQDRTGGALYFHQRQTKPSWAAEYTRTTEVGKHIFYKPHNGAARKSLSLNRLCLWSFQRGD